MEGISVAGSKRWRYVGCVFFPREFQVREIGNNIFRIFWKRPRCYTPFIFTNITKKFEYYIDGLDEITKNKNISKLLQGNIRLGRCIENLIITKKKKPDETYLWAKRKKTLSNIYEITYLKKRQHNRFHCRIGFL